MNAASFGVTLGALALGGVAFLYVKVDQLEGSVRPLTNRRVDSNRGERPEEPADAPVPPRGSSASRNVGGVPAREVGADGTLREPTAPDGLEKRIAELEARVSGGGGAFLHEYSAPKMYGSVDQMTNELKLTANQKDRVQSAVDNARLRIEEILKIPDEEGKSPWERKKEREEKLKEALQKGDGGGAIAFIGGMMGASRKKIPGRATTYGEEIQRVKKEAREEIASSLDPRQRESFDKARTDPLFGNEGEAQVAFSFSGDGVEIEDAAAPVTR